MVGICSVGFLYAARVSLFVGFGYLFLSSIIESAGLVAGYFGGLADIIIMRITDTIMSFPYILCLWQRLYLSQVMEYNTDS